MTKRSNKRCSRSEKDSVGCMWGFISKFDFLQGHSPRKMLSDRKHESGGHVGERNSTGELNLLKDSKEKHEKFDGMDDSRVGRFISSMASVKAFMEEEMSRAHLSRKIPSDELEHIQSDFEIEIHTEKNNKQPSKNCKVAAHIPLLDMEDPSSLGTHLCSSSNPSGTSPFDLASFLVDFYADDHGYREEHVDCKTPINFCHSREADVDRKNDHHNKLDSELAQKHSMLQKALGDVAEMILSQKLIGMKSLTDNRSIIQSKEFIDALEVLSSNEDLFLMHLRDPNSFLLKHIRDLQNAHAGKPSEMSREGIGCSGQSEDSVKHKLLHKQNGYSLFRRKDKSKETKPFKDGNSSQALNRIVILKPSPARIQNPSISMSPTSSPQSNYSLNCQEEGERLRSHFSFKEIKRRLKHALGESRKEWHLISMDAVLHRVPHGSKDSGDLVKTSCNSDYTSQPSMISKRKKNKAKDCTPNIEEEISSEGNHKKLNFIKVAHSQHGETILYEGAEQHFLEMTDTGDQIGSLPNRRISKTLGSLLSLPDYDLLSPGFSAGRDSISPRERIISPKWQFKQKNATNNSGPQNMENSSCIARNLDDALQVVHSSPVLETKKHESISTGKDLNTGGSTKITDIADNVCFEECNTLSVLSELSSCEASVSHERCEEDESPATLEMRSPEDEQQQMTPSVSTSPSSLLMHKVEAPGNAMERSERPSPVSVLEPFFSDDTISPECTSSELEDWVRQPRQLHFRENDCSAVVLTSPESETNLRNQLDENEARFGYIRTVLESSGLSCNELSERWHSSDQLLDPSLLDEAGVTSGQLQESPNFLFDCINEVLVEIREVFSRTPWIALVRTDMWRILKGGDITQDVCKRIGWHLQDQFPSTLDQIVGKDLKGGTWMDLQVETESTVFGMGDAILEYIMEETILELWD